MKSKTVYIVECHIDREDFSIIGIFNSLEDAEALKDKKISEQVGGYELFEVNAYEIGVDLDE